MHWQLPNPKEINPMAKGGTERTHERCNVVIGVKIREVNALHSVATDQTRLGFGRAGAIETAQKLPQPLGFLVLLLSRHLLRFFSCAVTSLRL